MTFYWCKFGFGKCFGTASQSSHWAGHRWLSYKTHFWSHITIWSRNGLLLCRIREEDTSKWQFFLIFTQLMKHPFNEFFHLSNLLQMLNNHRMVDTEFFSNFSYSCKRTSFNDALNWLLLLPMASLHSSSSRVLSPLQNFLNHHCTVCSLAVPEPNALLMLWVVSAALWPIFNSNKNIAQICFLSIYHFHSLRYI